MTDEVRRRKAEHVSVALHNDLNVPQAASWSDVRLVHQALPEVDLEEIDTTVDFLGQRLRHPLVISSMTGGHPDVAQINERLALIAEEYGLAMGVGSQRAALVTPELASTYTIARQRAPTTLLIANLGVPQLIPQAHHPA